MTAAERQHRFTYEEYVSFAERSEPRLEHWGGAILDMAGASPRHAAICANLVGMLRAQLRCKACRPFSSDLRVRSLHVGRTTYADATVVCGELELDPDDRTKQTVLNPAVLFEVPSPSTEGDDRGPKLDCYQTIASVRAVVLVAQDHPEVIVHERRPDGRWLRATYTSGTVPLAMIDCELAVAELYEDLPPS